MVPPCRAKLPVHHDFLEEGQEADHDREELSMLHTGVSKTMLEVPVDAILVVAVVGRGCCYSHTVDHIHEGGTDHVVDHHVADRHVGGQMVDHSVDTDPVDGRVVLHHLEEDQAVSHADQF